MAKKISQRTTKKATTRKAKKAPSPRPSGKNKALILQCDANKLRKDELHLEKSAYLSMFASALIGIQVDVDETTDSASVERLKAKWKTNRTRCDVLCVVGHSNEEGIRLASNLFLTWDEFATLIKPLHPHRILLVACKAGLSQTMNALFDQNRELRRIYASPINASLTIGNLMVVALPFVALNNQPTKNQMILAHGIAFLNKGLIREWIRPQDHRSPTSEIYDIAAQFLGTLLRL